MATLEEQFHADMVGIYERARDELGYQASYFLQMVLDLGGLATAKHLVMAGQLHEGFVRLWQEGRLDLSVEALVLKPQYRDLFSDEERDHARRRLEELGYHPDWGEE